NVGGGIFSVESTDGFVSAAAETVGATGWILLVPQEHPRRHATTKAPRPVVMPPLSIGCQIDEVKKRASPSAGRAGLLRLAMRADLVFEQHGAGLLVET